MYIVTIISKNKSQKCATKEEANTLARQIMSKLGLSVSVKEDRPKDRKIYSLTGGHGQPSIFGGNTWSESEVKLA